MSDQNPDLLKSQAEAALKRLEEARLHERCPKACKSCSQKHRKCQFKTGQYPKCDLCAKNNRECEIIPPPIAHTRRTADIGTPSQSQQYAASYGYPGAPVSEPFDQPQKTYASGSPADSSVSARSPGGNSPRSYAYPQGNAYQYGSTAGGQGPSSGHGPAYVGSQNQYAQYGNGQSHNPSWTPHQGRDPSSYYVPSQGHVHASSSLVPSSTDWSENRGTQAHAATGAIGQGYGYSGHTSSTSPVRQLSATTVPQIHTSTGPTYDRTAHGYQVASPTSPGGTYAVAGSSVYHMPPHNTSSVRYSTGTTGQGYNPGLSSAGSGSANEGSLYYQQNLHQ